jgi:hypothetical protein
MRKFVFPLLIMCALASANSKPLMPFRWDYRIILVATTSEKAKGFISEFKERKESIDERHVLWFVLDEESLATNHPGSLGKDFRGRVFESYFGGRGETQVRLIGKDGGVKAKDEKLDLGALFGRIDSMPMRQAEMKSD